MSTLEQRREHNLSIIRGMSPSRDPSEFIIEPRDYKRNNSDERYYRNRWMLTLLRVYDCACAMCGSDRDGLELDHFWLPKSKGGNFILRSALTGSRVNNAVPLCVQCNRKKIDNEPILTIHQHNRIAIANTEMTSLICERPIILGEPAGYEPGDEMRDSELDQYQLGLKRIMRQYRKTGEGLDELRNAVDCYLLKNAIKQGHPRYLAHAIDHLADDHLAGPPKGRC